MRDTAAETSLFPTSTRGIQHSQPQRTRVQEQQNKKKTEDESSTERNRVGGQGSQEDIRR